MLNVRWHCGPRLNLLYGLKNINACLKKYIARTAGRHAAPRKRASTSDKRNIATGFIDATVVYR